MSDISHPRPRTLAIDEERLWHYYQEYPVNEIGGIDNCVDELTHLAEDTAERIERTMDCVAFGLADRKAAMGMRDHVVVIVQTIVPRYIDRGSFEDAMDFYCSELASDGDEIVEEYRRDA